MTGETDTSIERLLLVRKVEEFLIFEAGLLDERRFEEWVELFTDDGFYWAPASPDQANPQENVSLFFDDVDMLKTRFGRLRHPRVHSQIPPSRTSHIVSNIVLEPGKTNTDAIGVSARFQMLEYRPGYEQRTFGGRYDYELCKTANGAFRIAAKKATILDCDAVHLPIALPF